MRNMAGMEGMEGGHAHANGTNNATMMMMDNVQMQISENSTDNNTAMQANSTSSSSMGNMSTTNNIVNQAAYQSAQYISNTTILRLFNETLKPLTMGADGASSELGNATVGTGEEQ